MKKFIFTVMIGISLLAMSSVTNASTSCTLTVSGPSGHGYSYEVSFTIWDGWNFPPTVYAGPTSWVSCDVGTNNNFTIPLDVAQDCSDRWIVIATVRQLLNGVPTTNSDWDSVGPLSSDEYYDPSNLIFSVQL